MDAVSDQGEEGQDFDGEEVRSRAGAPMRGEEGFPGHGDRDTTVPLEANSGEMRRRFEALGGKMQLIVPAGQGHTMWPGFFQCQELVNFVLAQQNRVASPPVQ